MPRCCPRRCKRCLKPCLGRTISFCFPQCLPECIWNCIVNRRVGKNPPANPTVLFHSPSGCDPVELAVNDLPSKDPETLRLVIISDTHERHRLVTVPEGDVLLHCGDILMSSSLAVQRRGEKVLRDFNAWLEGLPCHEKVVIGGNHDTALQRCENGQKLLSAAFLLQDSSITLPRAGIKVYGNAFSEGCSHNSAWQEPLVSCSSCSKDADVVLTHGLSSAIVKAVLSQSRPRLWASGHAHENHGLEEKDGTLFANAAIMNGRYEPVQSPVVVDLRMPSNPSCL
mmetsp:Transcript_40133/g.63704  ORF Transcript_40133/g.63704 Transcript_40133/m.63704 type:complete len:283 (-) Transcript_40133:118-966(-)